jgi:hypothetical protein
MGNFPKSKVSAIGITSPVAPVPEGPMGPWTVVTSGPERRADEAFSALREGGGQPRMETGRASMPRSTTLVL